jgi:hypothetical protein
LEQPSEWELVCGVDAENTLLIRCQRKCPDVLVAWLLVGIGLLRITTPAALPSTSTRIERNGDPPGAHFATAICSAKRMGPICTDAIALRRRYVNPNVGFDCYRSRRLVRCFRQPQGRGDGNKRTPPMRRKPHPPLMTVTFVGASRVLINLPSVLGHQRSD